MAAAILGGCVCDEQSADYQLNQTLSTLFKPAIEQVSPEGCTKTRRLGFLPLAYTRLNLQRHLNKKVLPVPAAWYALVGYIPYILPIRSDYYRHANKANRIQQSLQTQSMLAVGMLGTQHQCTRCHYVTAAVLAGYHGGRGRAERHSSRHA